jgi:L-lactate dehydrogenase complex protein LldG
MTAREDILARVRSAVAGAPDSRPVSRGYRDTAGPADLAARFVERVEDYKATVVRCETGDVPAAIAAALGSKSAVVPQGLPWSVEGARPDSALSHGELDATEAVVTTATLGIAETGTIVLDHGPGQGRRALSLIPDTHVCVVLRSQLVADVPGAVAALDPTRPQTWISGPSATSDIELNRVEGVHGPRNLYVVLVED